ncbi:MAG: CRTAC1 family protein [Myxococcota bacterium]
MRDLGLAFFGGAGLRFARWILAISLMTGCSGATVGQADGRRDSGAELAAETGASEADADAADLVARDLGDAGRLDSEGAEVRDDAGAAGDAELGGEAVLDARLPAATCLEGCAHTLALGCPPEFLEGGGCAEFCAAPPEVPIDMDCIVAAATCDAVRSCTDDGPSCGDPCCEMERAREAQTPPLPSALGGAFTAVTVADPAALAGIPIASDPATTLGALTSGLFGDLDGDGTLELVVTGGQDGEAVAFRYDASSANLVALEGFSFGKGQVLAVEDLDGDGATDLLLWRLDSALALWGDGAGGFTSSAPLPVAAAQDVAIRELALADLDSDGLLDWVGGSGSSACCSLACPDLVPMLRVGPRSFEPRPDLMASVNHANLTAILVAPLGPAKLALFGIGSVGCGGPYQGIYQRTTVNSDGWPAFEGVATLPPEANALMLGSAPMGAAVADANGDGFWDMAVTLDPLHGLYGGRPTWPMVDVTASSGIGACGRMETPETRAIFEAFVPWGVAWLDLDRDGRDDLVFTHGPDPGANPHGMFPQPVTAHWNAGDFRFREMSQQIGLDAVGEWRGLVVDDLEGDGDPDLFVGGIGRLPWLLRNDVATPHKGFALRLRGTTSNHLGIGAIVEVEVAGQGQPQRHVMGAVGNPVAVARPLLFIGLGAAEKADKVRIRWPSGTVQEVAGLASGQLHTVEEPATIVIEPAGRHLPAGGAQPAVVRAFARAADGSIRPDAVVEIRVAYGPGSFAGPAVASAGGYERSLVAPAGPGSTVVEVLIDGKPLAVRPRVFWD